LVRVDFDDEVEEEEEEVRASCVCFGCKFMVVEAGSEDSNRSLLMEIDAAIFVGFMGTLVEVVSKIKMKRSASNERKWCAFVQV
jgi:hypothetical protein